MHQFCQTPAIASVWIDALSRVPKSGLPGFGKKLCDNIKSKRAFVGKPMNVCLDTPPRRRSRRQAFGTVAAVRIKAGRHGAKSVMRRSILRYDCGHRRHSSMIHKARTGFTAKIMLRRSESTVLFHQNGLGPSALTHSLRSCASALAFCLCINFTKLRLVASVWIDALGISVRVGEP